MTVTFEGDRLVIASDSNGTQSSVRVTGGLARATLGFAGGSETAGSAPFALTATVAPAVGNTGGALASQGRVILDSTRLRGLLASQGRVILALDGLQPDVGHEVLWVVRDCLSGEVLLARSLLSGTADDLAPLLCAVAQAIGVPVAGVVSDGQTSIRRAVERALPGVPHQLCQFHFLREAALPVFEADRHAKVQLKAQIRGVRRLERAVEGHDDTGSQVVRGYCAAVRSAITEDGRAPLAASGLTLKGRLAKVAASLERATAKGGGTRRRSWRDCAG